MPIIKKANVSSIEQVSKEQVLFGKDKDTVLDEEELKEDDELEENSSN